MKMIRRTLLLVLCCVLIWPLTPLIQEAKAAQGLLFPIVQVSDPSVSGNTVEFSNTTRNIAVAMDGKIYVVYRNANGIYVNSSIDRGETMGTPVQVSVDTNEPEVAVSTNGMLYVSWVSATGVMFSRSTDGGQTFSTPTLIGSEVTNTTVHMATDGLHVYILDKTGTSLYVSHDSGQTFDRKTFPSMYVFSDVMVDRQTHEVIVQKDNPSIRYYKSSDYGETFGSAIDPGSTVNYSVGALGTDGINTYYYISGSQDYLRKINIATGVDEQISVPALTAVNQGRSLSADDYGNLVVGYVDGDSNLIFQESNDSGATFEDTVIVDTGTYSSAAINHTTGDILYAYEKEGQVYLAVYGEYLEGYLLNVSHAALSYAGQLINTASAYKTVTLTNDGETPITINSIIVSAPFTIEDASLSSIPVGGSADIRIRYEPTSAGDHVGTAVITYEGSDTKQINLSGTAVTVNPLSISSILDQNLDAADAPKLVPFTVTHTDGSFDFNDLILSATSNDGTLVPEGNMSFTGSDGSYMLSITPVDGQSGSCDITVIVNDLTNEASEPFELTVTAAVTHSVRIEDDDHSLIELRTIVDGSAVSTDGGAVNDPSAPAHYSFSGWDDGSTVRSSSAVSSFVPTADVTFTATYDIDQHTITMQENGGSTISDSTRNYNTQINEVDVGTTTQSGYDFDAWYEDNVTFNTAVTFPYSVINDDTWYANWTPIVYDILYNLSGGTNSGSNPATYTVETPTITFADASNAGYSFGGWFTDAGCTVVNEITEIALGSTGNVEVWAKWTPITYDITYNLDGGANNPNNPAVYNIENDVVILGEPSKDGYLFEGWYTNTAFTAGSEITDIPSGSTGNVEVWVKWTAVDEDDEQYREVSGNISIEGGEGQEGVPVTLNSNPRTVFTDANGDFSFNNVGFTDHTLVIRNGEGNIIGEYELDFTLGNETRVVIDGATAYITYESNAIMVWLDITMNASGTGTTLDDVTVINNPDTGSEVNAWSLIMWIGATIVLLVLLAGMVIIVAIRKKKYREV